MAAKLPDPYVSHTEPEALIPNRLPPLSAEQIRLEAWLVAQALARAERHAAALELRGDAAAP